jgi:hypothetical protein
LDLKTKHGLDAACRAALLVLFLLCLAAVDTAAQRAASGATVLVRNNHEFPYRGPVQFRTDLPEGSYRGADGLGEVRSGVARVVAAVPAGGEVALSRTGPLQARSFASGPLAVAASGGRLELRWAGERPRPLDLGLVVLPGTEAGADDVPSGFRPLDLAWTEQPGGVLRGVAEQDGYRLQVTALPYGGGWLDLNARLTRVAETAEPAYVAVVRRVSAPGLGGARLRFNGRVLDAANSPSIWSRDFWYTRGVDWISWTAGPLSFMATSGFAPAPTIRRDSTWAVGSHFYVWERTRALGNELYLISEVAGPNPEQAKSRYMRVTPYAPMERGDGVDLKWRLAVTDNPTEQWAESQLHVFAGHRGTARVAAGEGSATRLDVGVPAVAFGTSYFPYSTMVENLDFYRTPGLDRETWWPFSATMWSQWRSFVPQMRTDLHIIRAMGFDWVRLHHLELLQQMDTTEARAFLDFFTEAARERGLKILVDTEGPAEWIAWIARRYGDVITRYELENEILIPDMKPGDPARWTELYHATKRAAPHAEVFLTSAGNHGQFERLRALGVPFDRVGLHAYKHGPEWMEAFSSHALGTAGYASDIGKPATLGEFNWKQFTRLSPEARRDKFIETYENMLEPRGIPEFFQFHFQETIGVNPSISRSGIRHYETLSLDRRPKPEAVELMRLIREYTRANAPVRELPIQVSEATLRDGMAEAAFTLSNRTGRPLSVSLSAVAFGGVQPRLLGPAKATLQPGESMRGSVELRLPPDALPGTYHHFVEAAYGDQTSVGWGVASNPAAPRFNAQAVLDGKVAYPQGTDVVRKFDWSRPLAVAFGPDAPALELEMAYIVGNTLQSAMGRAVRISSTADLPDSLLAGGNLILVGTRQTNPMLPAAGGADVAGLGVVRLHETEAGTQWLLFMGETKEAVQAAATDFVLRFWPNAKDAAFRVTGMETGAAFGNRAGVTNPDPP